LLTLGSLFLPNFDAPFSVLLKFPSLADIEGFILPCFCCCAAELVRSLP
jgi:hypothetical protein